MKQLLRYAFPLCSALLLSACGHDRGSRNYDVERYDLDAEYNWQKNCLNASVRIELIPGEDGLPNIDLDSAVNVKSVRIDTYGDVDFEVQADNHLWVALDDITVTQGKPVVVVVDYEALPSDHLRPIGARQGDPVDIRAIYTDSEPQGGRYWMPSHDDPADRAIFAAKLRMDARETAIANGKLMADETQGSSRYMRYETAYPLPTYLMAFAISEFEVHSTKQGNTPVEVWHRKGVRGDHDVMAAELARMIGELETLLVPYPFERYALVLLPGHMVSGMENAGISFQRETSSNAATLSGDLQLAAHELAHQWFGDLMTVQTWDDVWIKEGMASLLEEEVFQRQLDASGAGTLNGHIFSVAEGDAIRDPEKAPKDKYDSGPYGRSAWFFTQIRRIVGDEAFWSTLRQLLEKHHMGNVSSEDIVQAFAPAFEPLGADKLRRALAAKALPRIVFSEAEQTATLTDSDGALIAPIEYAWVSLDGSQHRKPLLRGELNHLQSASPDDLLVLDPDDVHPEWETFIEGGALPEFLGPRRLPTTPEQLDVFFGLSGTAQRMALQINSENPWPVEADKLGAFLKNLHTDGAQALGLERACEAALANPSPQWTDGIRTAFTTMPTPFGLSAVGAYSACAEVLGEPQPWDADWQALATGLPNGELPAERLAFLIRFDSDRRDLWASVVDNADSLRAKVIASGRIPATLDNHPFFVERVRDVDASEVLRTSLISRLVNSTRLWQTELANGNAKGEAAVEATLGALKSVLKKDVTRPAHGNAICSVRNLLLHWENVDGVDTLVLDKPRWDAFVNDLKNAPLSERAAEISKDPDICN